MLTPDLIPLLAGAAGVVAVVSLFLAVRALLLGGRNEVVDRLERAVDRDAMGPATLSSTPKTTAMTAGVARFLRPLAWLAKPRRLDEQSRLRLTLGYAGFRGEQTAEIFLGVKLLLAPLLVIIFLQLNGQRAEPLAFPMDLAVSAWIAALGFWAPNLWLRGKITERKRTIERSLPDALDLLVTCVEAGLGIDQAINRVAGELALASPILAAELETVFLEVQAGLARTDGFRRMAERTGVDDLRSLSAMLIQTEMFGTSIARALRVHAEGMRIRRMQRAEERAGMVAVKLTIPLILCILPALFAVIMGPAVVTMSRVFGGFGR